MISAKHGHTRREADRVAITIEGNLISVKEYNGLCCTLAKWFIIEIIGM